MFWHRVPQFSWTLSQLVTDTSDGVAFNFTDAPSEAKLINQAMARGHDFIGQQNDAEEDVRAGSGEAALPQPAQYNWGIALAFEQRLLDRPSYERWVKGHFYQFRQPEPWLEHMRRYCFSYGTRLHGNIAAMLAGVRAMWIVHDMRLKEVCDHFRFPTVDFADVRDGVSLQALCEHADFSECVRVYPERYRTLFDYVDGAGLPHCLPDPIQNAVSHSTKTCERLGHQPRSRIV